MMLRIGQALRTGLYVLYVAALSGLLFHLVTKQQQHGDVVVWVMTGIMAGGTLMLSVYGFSLYRTRTQERAFLFFAGYCLAATVRMLFLQNGPGAVLFPSLSNTAILTLRAMGTLGSGAFHFNFIFDLFGEKRPRNLRVLVNGWMLAFGAVSLFLRLNNLPGADFAGLASGIPMLVLNGVLIATSGELKKNPVNWIFFVTTVIDIFSFLLVMLKIPNLAIVWNFVYTISITFLMANRYAEAMNAVETINETLEETVAQRTEEVVASQRQLQGLVRGISHDLKTPLTVVGLNLELLIDPEVAPEEKVKHAEIAYHRTLDLQRLTRNLFEAAQMETGEIPFHLQWHRLSGLLGEVNKRYAGYVESAGLTLVVRFSVDGEIYIDPEKIWSIFENTINNALRYTPEGGSITVEAGEPSNGFVELIVRDTGCGIDAEHLPHLFEQHYKADPSRGKGGDTGLGLYIVCKVIEGMGGSVRAESILGEGTSIIAMLQYT